MFRRLTVPLFLFIVSFGFVHVPLLYAQHYTHAPKGFLLSSDYKIQNNPYYEWVVSQKDHSSALEQAKIEYLIERIRKSPYLFIRNEEEHKSNEAAEHLAWKYHQGRKYAKTAHDFINNIASSSIITGNVYLVKLGGGIVCPVREILLNELQVLEDQLAGSANVRATPPAKNSATS